MKATLQLCPSCAKINGSLAGLSVYVRRPSYSSNKGRKDEVVHTLREKGLTYREIAQKAGMCDRQVYRILRGK